MSDLSYDRRLLEVLEAVSDLAPDERIAYLDTHCAGLPALRQDVERLLEHAAASPTAELAAVKLMPAAHQEGMEAGPFTLLEKRGEGGMGTVYRARHNRLGRDVAVKFIRHGRFATEAERRRFTAEQRSLSQLAHPHIVTLFDAGFLGDGQPYFAMEFVEGQPLDVFCNDSLMPLRERIVLFIKICEAVQHAHKNLIVHRDLKPGNLLVLPDGTPKLLDFGIAKLLEDGAEPATVTRVMTLTYAAPEQIQGGHITVATDVYALGVVLYELLAGHRPFASGSRPELVQAILSTEPVRPSTATTGSTQRLLQGDLDTIVLKALQKDSVRRYRSVQDMADDLTRYLEGRPVLARPDSFAYRAGKFILRHRASLVGTAIALALLVVVGVRYTVDVNRARDEAEAARVRAERVAAFTIDLFRPADPNVARGDTLTALEILDRSSERLLPALHDEPEVLSEMLDVIGEIYGGLGRPDEALALLERAVALRRSNGRPAELSESLVHLGEVQIAANQIDTARVRLEEAHALAVRAHGDSHPNVAATLDLLGHIAFAQARYDNADSLFREAISRFEHATMDADSAVVQRGLASALNNLGGVLFIRRELGASEGALRRAKTLYREIHGETPHTDLITIHNSLGNVYRLMGALDQALGEFEAGLQMARDVLGTHPTTATLASNLGVALLDGGCGDHVRAYFEEALAIRQSLLPPTHPSVALTLYNIGVAVQRCERDPVRAIPLLERSLEVLIAATKPSDLRVATNRHQLAEAYRDVGRREEAFDHARHSLAIRAAQLREPNRDIGRSLTSIGLTHRDAGRLDSSRVYALRALDQFDRLETPDVEGQRITLRLLADTLLGLGQCDEAAPMLDRYLAMLDPADLERETVAAKRLACPVSEVTP